MRKRFCYIAMVCLAAAVANEMVMACRGNDAARRAGELTAGDYRGHEYEDLGLPSRLKWATCNIGAGTPENPGSYFSWGETEPKDEYSSHRYVGSDGRLLKYNVREEQGKTDGRTVLLLEDDAAHRAWGGSWRMPTVSEMRELQKYCEWKDTTLNGKGVTRITGRNGRSIYLPHGGYRTERFTADIGKSGCLWLSSLKTGDCFFANSMGTDLYSAETRRYLGLNVRAVAR